jgi:hypothetical protein
MINHEYFQAIKKTSLNLDYCLAPVIFLFDNQVKCDIGQSGIDNMYHIMRRELLLAVLRGVYWKRLQRCEKE